MATVPMQPLLGVFVDPEAQVYECEQAQLIADDLGLALLQQEPREYPPEHFVLHYTGDTLSLCATGRNVAGPICVNFTDGSLAHRRHYGGGKSQLIAKAVGIKDSLRPHVLDVTAGLGQDGFVLAALGCSVQWVERSAVVHALLDNGIKRAQRHSVEHGDTTLQQIMAGLSLVNNNGIDYLASLASPADVIYLDPMFPERTKKAKVNKAMQAFHAIVGDDVDAGQLLQCALQKARYRVVIKRPRKAPGLHQQYPQLTLPEPGLVLTGKSARYDIYPLKKIQ